MKSKFTTEISLISQLFILEGNEIKRRGNWDFVELFWILILFPVKKKKLSPRLSKDISQTVLRLAKIPKTKMSKILVWTQIFLIRLLQNHNFESFWNFYYMLTIIPFVNISISPEEL